MAPSCPSRGRSYPGQSAAAVGPEPTDRPAPISDPPAPLPEGLAPGDPVVVLPEETGSGTVRGELLASGVHEIAVRRRSERAGELVVHFPREDYLVIKAG